MQPVRHQPQTDHHRLYVDSLTHASKGVLWTDYGSPEQRKAAIHYFIQRGYAQQHYPEENIHHPDGYRDFRELEAKSILWPDIQDTHLGPEQRHLQACWSNMWMEYWFESGIGSIGWERRRNEVLISFSS